MRRRPAAYYAYRTQEKEKKRSSSRIGFSISLTIHLLLFLFALFYVIDKQYIEETAVAVDVVRQRQPPKLRRRSIPRATEIRTPRATTSVVPRLRRAPSTFAQIPVTMGEPTLPSFAPPSLNEQLTDPISRNWADLDRRAIAPAHQVAAIRSPISVTSAEPPRLEIDARAQSVATEPLTLANLDTISSIVLLSEATRLPRFINKVIPRYPELAKRAGKEGVVILEAEIGTDGTSRNIKVIQGIGYGCDEAAITALRSSRFFPAYKGNSAVVVKIQIPYRFKFEEM